MTDGPLAGLTVLEMAGIGPGPYACMLLSDLGANVIRIDRPAGAGGLGAVPGDVLSRGRRSIAVDLKNPKGVDTVLKLVEKADVLIEGFRPGVMEKLGLGPDVCAARNPGLIYGRMTGWGQEGPLSHAAGHDINYIAVTGALDAIGRKDSGPVPPLNLVGDFAGGSMFLIMGILAALYERQSSGKGQVIDAAITDGVISLMGIMQGFRNIGTWETGGRQQNMLDGAAHYYDTYECADGKYVSIGSIEPQFYALLAEKLELDLGEVSFMAQFDKSRWPELKQKIADRIKQESRQHWCEKMEGTDVCFAPVLDMDEAERYPHNVARGNFVEVDGKVQTAPAPRFSRSKPGIQNGGAAAGEHTHEVLEDLGLGVSAIAELIDSGAVSAAKE